MDLLRPRPYDSRAWAKEIMGAPMMEDILATTLKQWVDECETIIDRWVSEHKIAQLNARAQLYMIWATTQHCADFYRQIMTLNDGRAYSDRDFAEKKQQATTLILASVGLGLKLRKTDY